MHRIKEFGQFLIKSGKISWNGWSAAKQATEKAHASSLVSCLMPSKFRLLKVRRAKRGH